MSKKKKNTMDEENVAAKATVGEAQTSNIDTENVSDGNSNATENNSLTSELENRVADLQSTVASKEDQLLRLHAEFDNYRKRTLKEKMELTKTAGESLLLNILPVVDDFERAIQAMDASTDVNAVKEGVSLIYKRFSEFLKQNGIKEIEAKELDFDTDLHEAITKIPAPAEELKGKVVDVIQKGYWLNDKVIRFSKVVIGE
jgi:molecular chaperone GrpE